MANFSGDVSLGARFNPVVLSAGAGRLVDFMWPDPLQLVSTASLNTFGRCRLLNQQLAVATGGFGGGGATVNLAQDVASGCVLNVLAGGGADGVGQIVRPNAATAPAIFQLQAKPGINNTDYNDLGAARVYSVYKYNAFGGGSAVADSGLEVTTSGGLIQSQSTAGVGWCRSATNTIIARCQTVGGGASANVAVTGPGTTLTAFDSSILHAYELQFISATRTQEASISWLIDGALVRRQPYGAGTVLPLLSATTAACWTAVLVNVAVAVNLSALVLRIIQAPTLQDCY